MRPRAQRQRAFAVWLFALTLSAGAQTLNFYYENRPPLTVTTPRGIGGLVGEPAMAAIEAAGLSARFVELPFLRHMMMVERNLEAGCAVGRFKTPEREKLGKYSAPIFREGPFTLLSRSGDERINSATRLSSLLAKPELRLLLKEGYSYGPALDGMIANARVQKVQTAESIASMVRMVTTDMADLVFASSEEAHFHVNASHGLAESRRFDDMPKGELRYFYCSKQVEDALLERLNKALPVLD